MATEPRVRITLGGLEQTLRLLVVDADLASTIQDSARRKAALRAVTAGDLTVAPGQQPDRGLIESAGACGVVVLSGFLVREWSMGAHVSADLLGPDDVIHPSGSEPTITMLRHTASWTALTPARLALLDGEFFRRSAEWPEIAAALLARAGLLAQRLSLRGALETFSVDARLLTSFWLWASQWGTVAGQGVVLRVPLSHERIARLIHARRPTVTSALGRLRSMRLVTQRQDGSWVLRDPALNGAGDRDEHGIAMPVIGEMLDQRLGVRAEKHARTTAGTLNEELQSSNDELETMNEELNNVNVLVDAMLESLGMGVAVLDRDLRVTMWNEHAKKLWGLGSGEVRDQHFLDLDIGLPVQKLHDALRACLAGNSDAGEQLIEARERTGRVIVCRVLCRPLQSGRGEVSGAILMMQVVDQPPSAFARNRMSAT